MLNTVVSLLGWWRHDSPGCLTLSCFLPTAAFSDSILLKANYFCLAVQLSPPGNFDNVDCLCFTKPLNVNAVLMWLLLPDAPQLLRSPAVSSLIKGGWCGAKTLFSIDFKCGILILRQESLRPLVTSSSFPHWLLSDRCFCMVTWK